MKAQNSPRAATNGTKYSFAPKSTSSSPLKIKTILVPVDFSEAGHAGLKQARYFARLTGANLLLIHVMENVYAGGEISFASLHLSEMRENITRELGALQVRELGDFKTNFVVREGLPFQEIVDVASREKVDLIVMATHGYTGLRHILLGSTTERVVRHALCPVLVVRSGPPGAKKKERKPERARKTRKARLTARL